MQRNFLSTQVTNLCIREIYLLIKVNTNYKVVKKKKKKNLFLFDHFVNTIHTYTLSMSYIYNLNNTNMKILANMVIMRINNNKSRVRRLL